ncbi:Uncharacterised protein [uncultured archaeon]|nr:Uncharacterised protein [uncultured archaeon]
MPKVEGGQRGRDIERQLVGFGQDSMVVSPYLVEDSVFCYPVSAYDCLIDPSLSHEASGGALAYQGHFYALMDQFPGSQPRSLVQGPGLASVHVNLLASLDSGPDDSQSSSPAHTGQPARIAVCQDTVSIVQEKRSFPAQ